MKLLYPHNEDHAKTLLENKKTIAHLLVDDLLLYQRPLKSKKSEITDCKYEIDHWKEDVNTSTGEVVKIPVYKKAVLVSHPLYQEYRIWDKIHNIKLIQLEKQNEYNESETNVDITSSYFKTNEDYLALFNLFNSRRGVTLNDYLEFCKRRFNLNIGKADDRNYIWNYPVEEEFKGNETRKSFEIRFRRCGFTDFENFLTQEKEIELWHYLYSVNFKDRIEIGKTGKSSIQNFFSKYLKNVSINAVVFEKLCNDFAYYPKLDSNYGAFSTKALSKLLSVMRVGDNFLSKADVKNNWHKQIISRANKILEKTRQINWDAKDVNYNNVIVTDVNQFKGELPFPKGLFNTFKDFSTINDFQFLDLTQASYLVYGRHSELAVAKYWDSPQKIREEINKELKHHSLNNPVAEKVLKETMKVVADIWEYHGNSAKNFFNEIHVEVARDLQKSNEDKKEIYEKQKNNRSENERLRNILEDFLCNSPYNAKKGNQDHFERLKIVEEGARVRSYFDKQFYTEYGDKFSKKEIDDLFKKQRISEIDFEKYKLWIEQGYKSPYTNKTIKLSDLFNGNKYNIDHILPRAAVTNDSLNNKIVCEKEINKEKTDYTGRAFISNFQGKEFDTLAHGKVTIVYEDEYVDLVKKQFSGGKKFILLAKDVPSGFTDSQMNNAKYIARKAMELLSHIVREQGEVEFRSKNILPVSGAITDRLKKEWKLNQVWTALLTPRFERLNKLFVTSEFGKYVLSENGHQYFDINTKYVLERNKNFELKRLDHRHHALDALIIALCTQNHVQYINNVNSGITNKKKGKMAAIKKQRAGIKRQIMYSEKDNERPDETVWNFMLPGSFRQENIEGSGKDSVCIVKWSNTHIKQVTSDYKKVILNSLEHCIVTFKNNFKLVSKSSNKYESYYDENGNLRISKEGKPIKDFISQKNEKNKHWSIRKSLHTDNPSGKIKQQFKLLKISDNLGKAELIYDEDVKDAVKEILGMHDNKIGEAKKYLEKNPIKVDDESMEFADFRMENFKFRKRQPILNLTVRTGQGALTTLDQVKDRIYKVADLKLRNDLLLYLKNNENDIDKAFSIEGIETFNANRKIPIKRLPICESSELKFAIGKKLDNNHKWVETGGNFYFKITQKGNKREFETIPLRESIEIEKRKILDNKEEIEEKDVVILSPNDLVYIPTEGELENPNLVNFDDLDKEQLRRIYIFNDSSGKTAYFRPNSISSAIIKNEVDKTENKPGSFDTKTTSFEGVQIKDVCWKLKVDRLGNIDEVNGKSV